MEILIDRVTSMAHRPFITQEEFAARIRYVRLAIRYVRKGQKDFLFGEACSALYVAAIKLRKMGRMAWQCTEN